MSTIKIIIFFASLFALSGILLVMGSLQTFHQPNINIYDNIETMLQDRFQWGELNCVNNTQLCYDYLQDIGYKVRIGTGYNWTTNRGHRWLMIQIDDAWHDFECTSLRFREIDMYESINVYNEKELVKWY